ncbi:MaoC family dehydratase [Clostridium beijerinckii]|uniref:MaoC family dehydratase n=1 Tax=Clostridium beijerinckii TaxID=1520 RepID=UPI00136180A5|nr:MaoC family dehydratase [Clostridium beijerinckii]MZK52787.1 enoyl-CoA hydratase [Clostridium beijerinckii]MZK60888.1 enoyl-CoA hydratase [Clostridium beijerinckii]MZK71094.1 enoyl-CoA hydratase [Clostridium beijerinckii]MZK76452.1 enoyl-CoA hydratase [Clostridium beijerinckii]MZK85945.1 enoyl-CoA hydratase [Clostridium beijerinckii]
MNYYLGQSASFSKTISEYDVYSFAGICGDFNPVHINKEEANKSIFKGQIAHGILVSSFISAVLGMYLPGPGTIYLQQNLSFKKPVYIGDTITATVVIEEIEKEKGIAKLKTTVTNQNVKVVVEGEAIVKLP